MICSLERALKCWLDVKLPQQTNSQKLEEPGRKMYFMDMIIDRNIGWK